jgi:flagellar biosynthesis/type III secretory pathway protein FliH
MNQADLADIKCFFKAAGSGQESFNLKTLWVGAFREEKKAKQEEAYECGYKAGYKAGHQEGQRVGKEPQEHCQELKRSLGAFF